MSKLRTWPARIFLQRPEGGTYEDHKGQELTWCADQVNPEDVEYVRIDLFRSLQNQLKKRAGVETFCKPSGKDDGPR